MRVDVKIVWNEIYMSMEFRCVKNILLGVYKMIKGKDICIIILRVVYFYEKWVILSIMMGKKFCLRKKIFFECWFVFYDNKMKFLV